MALKIKNLMHKFEYNFDFLSSKPGQSAGKFLVLVYACFFFLPKTVLGLKRRLRLVD